MITVEVVFPPKTATVRLADGATLRDAVLVAQFPLEGVKTGIFGKLAGPATVLKDGDRVELYRPLALDPKEARRRRAAAGRTKKTRV